MELELELRGFLLGTIGAVALGLGAPALLGGISFSAHLVLAQLPAKRLEPGEFLGSVSHGPTFARGLARDLDGLAGLAGGFRVGCLLLSVPRRREQRRGQKEDHRQEERLGGAHRGPLLFRG